MISISSLGLTVVNPLCAAPQRGGRPVGAFLIAFSPLRRAVKGVIGRTENDRAPPRECVPYKRGFKPIFREASIGCVRAMLTVLIASYALGY